MRVFIGIVTGFFLLFLIGCGVKHKIITNQNTGETYFAKPGDWFISNSGRPTIRDARDGSLIMLPEDAPIKVQELEEEDFYRKCSECSR
ncbi:MAG: hypothetical protein KC643_32290 [Nitrospira sp.]|nr:hypothetical protein [Nitrospira sp.]